MKLLYIFISIGTLLLLSHLDHQNSSNAYKSIKKLMKDKDVVKYYMYLKAIKGKKKYVPVPIPIFVLPIVAKIVKKKLNKESEFYLVKPHIKTREFVKKYIKINGGYHSLYY
ncbi:hypothetical protein TYRP_004962 [Tyrophagus putrescentiae]|nr:hypothetical protein TYRP_004962 [Tyrophagus putrescentiae]